MSRQCNKQPSRYVFLKVIQYLTKKFENKLYAYIYIYIYTYIIHIYIYILYAYINSAQYVT